MKTLQALAAFLAVLPLAAAAGQSALTALKAAGQLDRMNLVVVFDGDEEDAGRPLNASRQTLIDAAKGAVAAIGFEDGAGDPRTAVISRRSAGSWNLVTTGLAAHS